MVGKTKFGPDIRLKRRDHTLHSELGFSILEVMVAAGLMGVLAIGLLSLYQTGFNAQKALQARDDSRTLTTDMTTLLNDPTACANTFQTLNPVTGASFTQVRNASNTVVYQTGTVYGNRALTLTAMSVGGAGNDTRSQLPRWTVSSVATEGSALVMLTWTQTGTSTNRTGPSVLYRQFYIDVVINGANQIISCRAQAGPATAEGTGTPTYYPIWETANTLENSILVQTSASTSMHYGAFGIFPGALPGSPATGLMMVDSGDSNRLKYYNGSGWVPASSVWSTNGTSAYYNTGNVGIGTTNPSQLLHVSSAGATALKLTGASNSVLRLNTTGSPSGSRVWDLRSDNTAGDFYIGKVNDAETLITSTPFFIRASDSNVGIGTTTPTHKLQVAATSGNAAIRGDNTVNHGIVGNTTGASGYGVVGQSSLHYGVYGRGVGGVYGIATGAGNGVYGTAASAAGVQGGSTGWYAIVGQSSHAGYGGVLGYTQDTTGFGILGHANTFGLWAYTSQAADYGGLIQNTGNSTYCYIAANGGYALICGGLTSGVSDGRLKKDIVPLNEKEGLAAILNITPVHYRWKDPRKKGREIGFIAQDVKKVLPELVGQLPEPIDPEDPKSMKNAFMLSYDRLAAPIVKAIQELKILLDELREDLMGLLNIHEEKIEALTADNKRLRQELDSLQADTRELKNELHEMRQELDSRRKANPEK